MSEELRLGFHRLGERLEEPVNLGVAIAFLWVIAAWLVGVVFAMSFLQVLLIAVAGIAAVVFLRGEITEAALRMSQSHKQLEQRRTGATA